MKKIALLKCPGALNIGNEFINIGGEYVVKRLFKELNIECEYYDFEFFETDQPQYEFRMPWNISQNIDFIKSVDLIVIFGGSIFSQHLYQFLDEIGQIKTKKIILGAGFYAYDQKEVEYVKNPLKEYSLISCRDNVTYKKLENNNLTNILNGIDMAFFIEKSYSFYKSLKSKNIIDSIELNNSLLKRKKISDINFKFKNGETSKGYCVINIDMLEPNKKLVQKLLNKLKPHFREVYVVENTSKLHNFNNYIHLSRWSEFYKIYANADFVITSRIHSSVVCSTFGTPFLYLGKDSGGKLGRNTLFNQIDTKLEYAKLYCDEELEKITSVIDIKREEYIKELKSKVGKILSDENSNS